MLGINYLMGISRHESIFLIIWFEYILLHNSQSLCQLIQSRRKKGKVHIPTKCKYANDPYGWICMYSLNYAHFIYSSMGPLHNVTCSNRPAQCWHCLSQKTTIWSCNSTLTHTVDQKIMCTIWVINPEPLTVYECHLE